MNEPVFIFFGKDLFSAPRMDFCIGLENALGNKKLGHRIFHLSGEMTVELLEYWIKSIEDSQQEYLENKEHEE